MGAAQSSEGTAVVVAAEGVETVNKVEVKKSDDGFMHRDPKMLAAIRKLTEEKTLTLD